MLDPKATPAPSSDVETTKDKFADVITLESMESDLKEFSAFSSSHRPKKLAHLDKDQRQAGWWSNIFRRSTESLIPTHPLVQLFLFSTGLAICCGPAYNQNAVKALWRHSGFLSDAVDVERLMAQSLKALQTTDCIAGGVVGVLLGAFGVRYTHTLGYFIYALGILFMCNAKTVYTAMILQGFSLQMLFNSVLSVANRFDSGSKVALSLLSGSCDLATVVYPLAVYLLMEKQIGTAQSLITVLVGIAFAGCVASWLLLPDVPYFPVGQQGKQVVAEQFCNSQELETSAFLEADCRDMWRSKSLSSVDEAAQNVAKGDAAQNLVANGAGQQPEEYQKEHEPNEMTALVVVSPVQDEEEPSGRLSQEAPSTRCTPALLGVDSLAIQKRRDSALSLSMVAIVSSGPTGSRRESTQSWLPSGELCKSASHRLKHRWRAEGFLSQCVSFGSIVMGSYFVFSLLRANLYLDGNEEILMRMGDVNKQLAEAFAYYLPFGFLACLINGAFVELFGVLPVAVYLNTVAIAVNVLSMLDWLAVQRLTFVLFILSKASVYSTFFSFLLESFGFQYFSAFVAVYSVIGGLMNHFCGSAIVDYVMSAPDKNRWFGVNGVLAGLGVVFYIPLVYLWYRLTIASSKAASERMPL